MKSTNLCIQCHPIHVQNDRYNWMYDPTVFLQMAAPLAHLLSFEAHSSISRNDRKALVICQSRYLLCSSTRVPPFFTSCMRRGFLLMRASFVMLWTTRSDARARKGVSFYLSACRFPVFLYTNCTSVYLVWQIHFFSDLEMYYACGFVIKAMIICSSQMGVLDFGPALAYFTSNG